MAIKPSTEKNMAPMNGCNAIQIVQCSIVFQWATLAADEPYFSQSGSMKEMTGLRVCTGDERLSEFMKNGDG